MQRFETTVYFSCPKCGKPSRIEVEVPELDLSGESMSDHSSEGTIQLECPECGTVFDGYAMCSAYECTITLEDGEIELQGDPPMYSPQEDSDWSQYEIPDDPYGIFISTYEQMIDLIEIEISWPKDEQVIARMVFVQLISAMEAFLADTLITSVLEERPRINALLAADKEINKQNFSLRDIAADETLVERHVREYLRKIIYHNLGKVQFLYSAALDLDVKTNDEDWAHLHKAILSRHDCVHRNGYDSEGNKNASFSTRYVRETAETIKRLVDKIDSSLSAF